MNADGLMAEIAVDQSINQGEIGREALRPNRLRELSFRGVLRAGKNR